MKKVGLLIALEESGGFSWAESCGCGRMGIYDSQTVHTEKRPRDTLAGKKYMIGNFLGKKTGG